MGSPLHQAALSFFKALSRPLFSDRLCPHYNLSIEQDRTYLEHLIQTHQELQLGSVEEITDTLVSASPSMILYWEKIALFIHTSHLNACVYNYIYIFRHVPLYVYISSGAHATFWTLSFGSSVDWPVHRDVATLSQQWSPTWREPCLSHPCWSRYPSQSGEWILLSLHVSHNHCAYIIYIPGCAHRSNLTHKLRI